MINLIAVNFDVAKFNDHREVAEFTTLLFKIIAALPNPMRSSIAAILLLGINEIMKGVARGKKQPQDLLYSILG